MIEFDDCDEDVAAILGLQQGATAGRTLRRPVRSRRWIWLCAALAAGLMVAVQQPPAVDHLSERSAPIAHDLAPARNQLRADMLLASPENKRKVIDHSANHDALTILNEGRLHEIAQGGSRRGGSGLGSSRLTSLVTLRRSQVLARILNIHPTTVLRLAAHERPGRHTFSDDITAKAPDDGSSRVREKKANVVQAERLEAIDAIRILRQR